MELACKLQINRTQTEWKVSLDHIFINFQTRDKDGNIRHNSHAKPKADGLVIHIHGGGFVAQSSKSHEVGILR